MELKNIFVGIIVFAVLAMGFFSFQNSLLEKYEDDGAIPITDEYEEIYTGLSLDGLEGINETTTNMMVSLDSGKDFNPLQFFILAPKLIYSAFQIIFRIPWFIVDLIGVVDSSGILGSYVGWAVNGFFIIIVAFISFAALAALLKWRL